MKKASSAVIAATIAVLCTGYVFVPKLSAGADESSVKASKTATAFQPFYIYFDDQSKSNHFFPTGWMGDYGDLRINNAWTTEPHSGKTCIKISYNAKMSQKAGWTGMYWQQPMSNWGDKKGGFNMTGATKLSFWAKGEKGGEKITEFKMGGITGEFPDSDTAALGPVELTNKWKKYSIDLKGKDLTNVIGGFCWSASKDDNPNGMIFFMDDVMYE
jgi:hypothetical protein